MKKKHFQKNKQTQKSKTAYFSFLSLVFAGSFFYHYKENVIDYFNSRNESIKTFSSASQANNNFTQSSNVITKEKNKITENEESNENTLYSRSDYSNENSNEYKRALASEPKRESPRGAYPEQYSRVLNNASKIKNYEFNGKNISLYKRNRGSFRWVRLVEDVNSPSSTSLLTRADQLLIRLHHPSDLFEVQSFMQAQEQSFRIRPFLDGLYIAEFSPETSTLKLEEIAQLMLEKPEWVSSVSEDFVYVTGTKTNQEP